MSSSEEERKSVGSGSDDEDRGIDTYDFEDGENQKMDSYEVMKVQKDTDKKIKIIFRVKHQDADEKVTVKRTQDHLERF